jgi:hypothetical protein
MISLSGPGREALESHWRELETLRDSARRWRPQPAPEPA